jgi:DNA-binding CsgD family transcriptional regulator
MRDLDTVALLRGVEQLSALSGRLVRLSQRVAQRLSIEDEAISASADHRIVHADLLSALKLQNQVVAEHFAIVRSMSRKKRRHPRIAAAQFTDVEVPARQRSSKARIASRGGSRAVQSSGGSFTDRERQIIQLVTLGYRNKQIGQSLCISEQTVKNHLNTIFGKAGVTRRHDLVRHASDTDDAGSKRLLDSDLPTNEAGTEPLARRVSGN